MATFFYNQKLNAQVLKKEFAITSFHAPTPNPDTQETYPLISGFDVAVNAIKNSIPSGGRAFHSGNAVDTWNDSTLCVVPRPVLDNRHFLHVPYLMNVRTRIPNNNTIEMVLISTELTQMSEDRRAHSPSGQVRITVFENQGVSSAQYYRMLLETFNIIGEHFYLHDGETLVCGIKEPHLIVDIFKFLPSLEQ